MGSKSRAAGAYGAGRAAANNTYVRRLIEDEELRHSLRDAFVSARAAYDRVAGGKHPGRMLIDDRKTQRELRNTANSLREAADSLRGRKEKRHWFRRLVVLGIVGGGLALVLNEGLRKKVLDALFGAEEEFEYTSTTSPEPEAEPAPATDAAAADTAASPGT